MKDQTMSQAYFLLLELEDTVHRRDLVKWCVGLLDHCDLTPRQREEVTAKLASLEVHVVECDEHTFYEILGVPRDADTNTIKAKYRQLCRENREGR